MRISDWSSDVCSADLLARRMGHRPAGGGAAVGGDLRALTIRCAPRRVHRAVLSHPLTAPRHRNRLERSEEHTSELQSLMRISYAVFCLKKKKNNRHRHNYKTLRDNMEESRTKNREQ